MVLEIIKRAQAEGIQLYVDAGRLKYRARHNPPSNGLTDEIKQEKAALIALLSAQSTAQSRDMTLTTSGLDRAPLTPNQARVFYQGTAFDTGDTYVMAVAYRFEGLLDPARLRTALQKVIERHHILRSRFFVDGNGVPTQHVVADPTECLTLTVEHAQPPDHWLNARAQTRCDLSKGRVLNVGLLQAKDQSYLHIACHHIAFDGSSYQTLFAELARFYDDPSTELPSLPLQFVDYANSDLAQRWSEPSQAYWRAQMEGVASFNGLPSDKPRRPVGSFSGQSLHRVIPKDIDDALSALAAENGVSRFTTCLAAFFVQLSRYLRTQDCVVGTPLSGRVQPGLDGLIGFFANALPLRAQVDHDLSFAEFLNHVHKISLMAQQHQDLDVRQVISDLGYAGETAFTPLNQIMFSFEENRDEDLVLGGHSAQKLPLMRQQAAFDLECSLIKHANGRLEACWVYSDALFETQTISDFARTFETTLRHLLDAPDQPMKEISISVRSPQFAPSKAPADPTPLFIDMFEAQAAASPQAIACKWVADDGVVKTQTYGALNAQADRMVATMLRLGIGATAPVAVCVGTLGDTIANLIAVHKIGAAYMILDPALPADRSQIMFTQAGCQCAIGAVAKGQVPPGTIEISAAQDCDDGPLMPEHQKARDAANVAVILFTSGSTGMPKGVKLSQASVSHFLMAAQGQLTMGAQDCFAVSSTLTFDAHILEILLALAHGGSLALLDPARARDAGFLRQDQDVLGFNFMFATPTSWQLLHDTGWCPQNGMTMVSGGENLPQHLSDAMLRSASDVRLLNVYGPSEATVFNLCAFMKADAPVHMGQVLPGNSVYLQDPYGHPCAPSCRGEIVISGPQVGQGYVGQQPGFFVGPNGWSYATGDIARKGPDGRFIMVGREDFQVKINGVRLELDEISAALERHPAVNRATVVVDRDNAQDTRLAAFVETDLNQTSAAAQLVRYLATLLPRSHLPGSFTVLDRMPLTPSGKIDRKALPAPSMDAMVARGRAPTTALERQICAIWSALLERPVEDVDAGFFEIGGHSLLAIKMINRVNRACGTELRMRDVVGALSVADLVLHIEGADRVGDLARPVPVLNKPLPAPLSFAQERIWTIDQIDAAGSYYTIPLIYEIKGAGFDRITAMAFLKALVEKHPILATVYDEEAGTPYQDQGQSGPCLDFTDVTTSVDPEPQLIAAEKSCFGPPFDLRNGPVLRSHLVKVDEAHHRWFLALHHIAFDGASLALFVQELRTFVAQGTLAPSHAPSYADYAHWQRETYDPNADLTYWKDRLQSAPPVHQLPLDRPRPAAQSFAGETITQQLHHDLTHDLRTLASGSDSTEFATVFALFAAYLQLISGQNDIVLGTPVANRQSPELRDIIGCFINTVPLRMQLTPGESVACLVSRVNADLQRDLSHDGVPFEKLVQAVCTARSFSHTPIFQIMIQLDNSNSHDFQVEDTQFSAVQPIESEAKFDLTLGVRLDDGISLSWNFATDLFDRDTIKSMMAGFLDWAASCLASPQAPLSAPASMERLQKIAGPVRAAHKQRVADRFLAAAAEGPDRIALCDGQSELTYHELTLRAKALARVLGDHQVDRSMLVGVHMERSADLVIAMLACCLHGCAYLPLDPAYPQARRRDIVVAARPALILCTGGFVDLPAAQFDVAQNRHKPAETTYVPRNTRHGDPSDTAYVIYTSGSTGQPKGVQVGHDSLANFLTWMSDDLGLDATARVLQVTSPSFDISLTEILAPLALGGSIVMAPSIASSGVGALLDTLVRHDVSVLQVVPGMLQALLDGAGNRQFPGITRLYCGGETVPAALLRAAGRSFPNARIFAVYGPTEATIWASAYDFSACPTEGPVPLGQPVANSWLNVVDDTGQPVSRGQVGQLCIGGAALALGYLGDQERTADVFGEDPHDGQRIYQTGDLVRVTSDGQLLFVGRSDTQIKLRGHRIELGEIEAALLAAGAAFAVCVPCDDRLTAFVDATATDGLRKALASRLPDYMMPTQIIGVDSFPRTPNGKIDRRQLAEDAQRISSRSDDAPPIGETEETLAEIWQETLDSGPLGRHQNFFAIGGHSLLAIRIMATVSAILEEDVPVRVLFANPCIADLAAYIDGQVLGLSTKDQIT